MYAVQRIMIIDGAMGTVIQQYKLQVILCFSHYLRLTPLSRVPRWSRVPLTRALFSQEEDFRASSTFNDDPKWTTGTRLVFACYVDMCVLFLSLFLSISVPLSLSLSFSLSLPPSLPPSSSPSPSPSLSLSLPLPLPLPLSLSLSLSLSRACLGAPSRCR